MKETGEVIQEGGEEVKDTTPQLENSGAKNSNTSNNKSNPNSVSYLWIMGILIVLFAIYLGSSHCALRRTQNDIKNCHKEHIAKVDSLALNIHRYSLHKYKGLEDLTSRVFVDSLVKSTLAHKKYVTPYQLGVLSNMIDYHFEQLKVASNEYEAKFLRDSLLLSAERTLIEGQAKNMLELHLDKVEHEYGNITMWAAILTLVFLVFSFYSMFKLEEYIKQGKEAAKEIETLKDKSLAQINSVTNNHKNVLNSALATFSQQTDNIVGLYNQKLNAEIHSLQTKSSASVEESKAAVNKQVDLLAEQVQTRYDELEQTAKRIESMLEVYQRAISELKVSAQTHKKE